MAAPVAHTINGIPTVITPTAAMVRVFEASLCAVACSMPSHQGGGTLGHVGALMPGPQFLAITGAAAWVDSIPPVQLLVIPAGTNAALTSVMLRQHTTDLEEFSQFVTNMNTLWSLFMDNIDNTLIGHLCDRLLNFASVHP